MRPSFHPRLINDPFSDPGLFIPFHFEKRALLFDLGELQGLSSKDILKLSHVFVSHTHVDHFIGFDTLLRVFIGREKDLYIFGPPGFFRHVEGKLAGYTWNLVHEYESDFRLIVTEVHPQHTATKVLSCKDHFRARGAVTEKPFDGILLEESSFHIEAALLDHRVPCLGLSLVEHFYVNIIKEGMRKLDLEVGPWINRFKQAIYEKKDPAQKFTITLKEGGERVRRRSFILSELIQEIALISPGQKISYITDVIGSPHNYEKILPLIGNADVLFIEAAFMDCDHKTAQKKYHLTAREAGELAHKAGVKQLHVFHFSPRYMGKEEAIRQEAMEAYSGTI